MEQIEVLYVNDPPSDLDSQVWHIVPAISIGRYWSGEVAPTGRHFSVKLLWSDGALYVRFETAQKEPLIVSDHPDTSKKTIGLWERDVCEIFIAPEPVRRNEYFEFEIAPTGEWIDLALNVTDGQRDTDWNYSSGMQTSAKTRGDRVSMMIKIGWAAFGKAPANGDVWLGNVFRCVGAGESRGYLAWQPTFTEKPNFHVPERFGELVFVDRVPN
jgi:alpha-galactosidase